MSGVSSGVTALSPFFVFSISLSSAGQLEKSTDNERAGN